MNEEAMQNNVVPMQSTRNKIIHVTFGLVTSTNTKKISLSDIAQKIGISKQAIFKHFKNKEDLFETLKNVFYDDFCELLKSYFAKEDDTNSKQMFIKKEEMLLHWFLDNPHYLYYFLIILLPSKHFIVNLAFETKKREIEINFLPYMKKVTYSEQEKNTVAKEVYLRTTDICFLLHHLSVLQTNPSGATDNTLFVSSLVNFFFNGLGLHEEINNERFNELSNLCDMKNRTFPPENKMLKALSCILETIPISEITVEKIATELGMAKSSIYSHFKTKDEMIQILIDEELSLMLETVKEIAKHCKTPSEYVYVYFRSQIEYLLKRTSFAPICNRLSTQGFYPQNNLMQFYFSLGEDLKNKVCPSFSNNIYFTESVMGTWFFVLSVTAINNGKILNYSHAEMIEFGNNFFYYIKNGVKGLTSK